MNDHNQDDGSKKVKNIAAVLFLLVLTFLVGGSYLHQQTTDAAEVPASAVVQP
ncbi:hypothetical protein [Methylomonas albis]|jgi:hypothetical protein|uniref:Uncharacterized protein n=1 Tax=Methylomonas albis TaxID=1854563 RepID=A0ABR9D037_9GAMM|nr:hypothetical protein [Methylomonas albis]MBD9356458.1 hypothetical protein [Methylomonas albis]CAD6879562.1 hypothetical protein [Methylomonas albis]